MKEFGFKLRKYYIHLRWKYAVKLWFRNDTKLLNKLIKQLNKVNYELRQIRSSKKVL